MYELFQMARLRCNRIFVPWALLGSGAAYGQYFRLTAQHISILFGLTTHYKTLLRHVSKYTDKAHFYKAVNQSLADQNFEINNLRENDKKETYNINMVIYDNTQKNFGMKHYRGGRTSFFLKLTSVVFMKLEIQSSATNCPSNERVEITYMNQKVPSSPYLPTFDHLEMSNPQKYVDAIIQPHKHMPPTPLGSIDTSGNRCNMYLKILFMTQNLRCIKRHISLSKNLQFQPNVMLNNKSYNEVQNYLSEKRKFDGVLFKASSFQRNTVLCYRNLRPKAKLLCMPILPDDPTTNRGTASVILKILHLGGLLVPNHDVSTSNNSPMIAPKNVDGKYLFVVGDGFSHERWRYYSTHLVDSDSDMNFENHYKQCREIKKALNQTVLIPGDLHLGWFHTLGPIDTLFYGVFYSPSSLFWE